MNFIVFPGQGSQKLGMGKELSENFIEAKDVFQEVNDAINFDLTKIMWEGTDAELALTSNAQPALMACSVAVFRVLQKLTNKNLPDLAKYICGHSLGEYTAMTVAEVFTLRECAALLRLRGNAMQEAVPAGKGAMAAFIGVDINTTQKILVEVKSLGICDIGNDNADGQVVISGDKLAVEKAIQLSKDFGVKRAVILPVSAPFHCRLMLPAQTIMKEALSKINFYSPVIPIVSNTTALPENNTEVLKNNLIDQVTSTVRWRETMHLASKLGVKKIIELGSGKVLTGIAKRMVENVTSFNIEKPSDFDQLKKE
ncbi:ACP S-malonyltransferase [Alphaproteobacteria bacterium]|nr:ACP S-malonyltransferase [Alphaproteobacteria bacterium]